MASITERNRGGKVTVLAQITRRAHNYTESRSFPTKKAAEVWARKREKELDALVARGEPLTKQSKAAAPTLGAAIERYIEQSANIGKSKRTTLTRIKDEYTIATKRCDHINERDIVDFANQIKLRPSNPSPSTVLSYLAHLGSVFTHGQIMFGYPLDKTIIDRAKYSLKHVGAISRSVERERLPTIDELNKLFAHFAEHNAKDARALNMIDITLFAIFSARRVSEITSIKWTDYEAEEKRVKVRGMKNPNKSEGSDVWCQLTDEACKIIDKQPRSDERIFPVSHVTISRRFVNACQLLGIEDLHYHDFRHLAATRLAEIGYTVPQIASITGHKTWKMVARYSHVAKIGDRLKDWEWLHKI